MNYAPAPLHGKVIGTIRVVQRESGIPFRWRCVCTICGFSQVQRHDVLQTGYPRCANSACGRKTDDAKTTAELAYEKNAREWRDYEAQEQAKRDANKAREQAEQAARIKARQEAKVAAKQEAERNNRAVLFQIASDEIAATCDYYGLTSAEREELLHRLPQSEFQNPFPVLPKYIAEEIIERRGQS